MRALIIATTLLLALAGCSDSPSDGQDGPDDADTMPVTVPADFDDTGTITLGVDASQVSGCGAAGQEGVDVVTFTWTIAAPDGATAVKVRNLQVTLTLTDQTLLDADLEVSGPDGALIGSSTEFNPMGTPTETVSGSGTYGPGDYTIRVLGCSGSGTFDVEGTATLTYTPKA